MFDNLHEKIISEIAITDTMTVQIKTIGDQPGHKQSGQYLWPATKAAACYLMDHWVDHDLSSPAVGAGCGVEGIVTWSKPTLVSFTQVTRVGRRQMNVCLLHYLRVQSVHVNSSTD